MAEQRPLHVEVVTPDGEVYSDDVGMVVLPGVDGELGVLPRHQPLVTLLAVGETRIRDLDGTWEYIATGIGYAQVLFDKVLVVVRPRRARRRHRRGARRGGRAPRARAPRGARRPRRPGRSDYFRAEQALKRAENRLQVAGRRR